RRHPPTRARRQPDEAVGLCRSADEVPGPRPRRRPRSDTARTGVLTQAPPSSRKRSICAMVLPKSQVILLARMVLATAVKEQDDDALQLSEICQNSPARASRKRPTWTISI